MSEQIEDKITFYGNFLKEREYTCIDYTNVYVLAHEHGNPLFPLADRYLLYIRGAYENNNYTTIHENGIVSAVYGIDCIPSSQEGYHAFNFRYLELFMIFAHHAPDYCKPCSSITLCPSDKVDDAWKIIDEYILKKHAELVYNKYYNHSDPTTTSPELRNYLLEQIASNISGKDLSKYDPYSRLTCYTLYNIYHDTNSELHNDAKYYFEAMAFDHDQPADEFMDNHAVLSLFGITYHKKYKEDKYIFDFHDLYIWNIIKDKLSKEVKINTKLHTVEVHNDFSTDVFYVIRDNILNLYVEWFREYEKDIDQERSAESTPEDMFMDVIKGITIRISKNK